MPTCPSVHAPALHCTVCAVAQGLKRCLVHVRNWHSVASSAATSTRGRRRSGRPPHQGVVPVAGLALHRGPGDAHAEEGGHGAAQGVPHGADGLALRELLPDVVLELFGRDHAEQVVLESPMREGVAPLQGLLVTLVDVAAEVHGPELHVLNHVKWAVRAFEGEHAVLCLPALHQHRGLLARFVVGLPDDVVAPLLCHPLHEAHVSRLGHVLVAMCDKDGEGLEVPRVGVLCRTPR
mmetsp:Transcript_57764/g.179300  ORF Transcript_57764/g.179300 Transcript_57764/m.179300 type:complete len:236 (-) Transcript_57764:675-1382(-)